MDLILKEISGYSKLYNILIWSRLFDKSPYQLSGGQQKILQLLTILTSKASVILLDEPFAGLDDRACHYFVSGLWRREIKEEVF